MNSLNELKGKKVYVELSDENNTIYEYPAKVESIHINDFYFKEKGESIYIEVNVSYDADEVKSFQNQFDSRELSIVPLSNIRYAGE